MAITLTAQDVRDLDDGHTISVITEDGVEVVLDPENVNDYDLQTETGPYQPSPTKTFTADGVSTLLTLEAR